MIQFVDGAGLNVGNLTVDHKEPIQFPNTIVT